jgi:SAM-dependent methyltransferase
MSEPAFLTDTRAGYDAMAPAYARQFAGALASQPWDRAMLAGFAEVVDGPVADVGCGPGVNTAYLKGLGVDVFGIDLSPRTVELARRRYPQLRFEVGSMTGLDLPDGSLGGVAAIYSIIHVPARHMPGVFAEFWRVLAPGGHLLLAFQVGDDIGRRTEAFGHRIAVDWHRQQPDRIEALLVGTGFEPVLRMVRAPRDYAGGTETTPQAHVVARKPSGCGGGRHHDGEESGVPVRAGSDVTSDPAPVGTAAGDPVSSGAGVGTGGMPDPAAAGPPGAGPPASDG